MITPPAWRRSRWVVTLVLAALVIAALAWVAEPMTAQAQAQAAPSAPAGFDAPAGIGDSAPGGSDAVSYTVPGLTPGTAYNFKIRAVNAAVPGGHTDAPRVTPQTIAGAWSYETVIEPATITAGGGVASRVKFRAKFQADQGSLTSLSARVTSSGSVNVFLSNFDANNGVGFSTSDIGDIDDTYVFVYTSGVVAPSSGSACTRNLAAGSMVCETAYVDEILYAKSDATTGDYTVVTTLSDAFTYTAVVNGEDSTQTRRATPIFPTRR